MTKSIAVLLLIGWVSSSSCGQSNKHKQVKVEKVLKDSSEYIITGAEQTWKYLPLLRKKKVGLVVNQTSLIGKTHLVDSLLKLGIHIVKLFAPEHGFRGNHSAGAEVKSGIDTKTGLKITSLYGANKKPKKEDIQALDIILFDIQDVGVRFYTYISTMHYVMEACAEQNKTLVILDRPNPNGYYVDGPTLKIEFQSFIGMHPVPLVHGLTVAEFATMINGEKWLSGSKSCKLEIVKCKNYKHNMKYKLPMWPSPNLKTMEAIYLYPSLGLFEGTNVSVGRGTPKPFEWIGRPGLTKGETVFTPQNIPGVAIDPPHLGKPCNGILLSDFAKSILIDSKSIYLDWLILMYQTNKPENGDFFITSSFDRLAGSSVLRQQIIEGKSSDEIKKSWQTDLEIYKTKRKKYLLYP